MGKTPKRPKVPELWGWSEFLRASERTDSGLRWMRDQRYTKEFPEPVAELAQGPIFLAEECRWFIAEHPPTDVGYPVDVDVARLRALRAQGRTAKQIATELGVSPATVYRRLKEHDG
jgi:hypothetical protein